MSDYVKAYTFVKWGSGVRHSITGEGIATLDIGGVTLYLSPKDYASAGDMLAKLRAVIKHADALATEIEARLALGVEEPPK